MISRLRGKVVDKTAEGAVIDCGGVGYGVSMSLNGLSKLAALGGEATVLVYTHVGQEVLRLFGFVDDEERATFRVLISLTRVGPKLAMSILSALSPGELANAVSEGDLLTLSRVPGVGKKTAERLLLELRDKVPSAGTALGAPRVESLHNDLKSALVNLGYKEPEAEQASRTAQEALPAERDVALLVREALRRLTRR